MEKEILKLQMAVNFSFTHKRDQKEALVYLSIVALKNSIKEVAKYFLLSEEKVQNILCSYGVQLKNNTGFRNLIAKAYSIYNVDSVLKFVA